MASAGSIVVSLLMNTGQFETDTKRAEGIAKKRAEAIDKAFQDMGQKIGLAAAAAGGAIVAMIGSTTNAAKEISNLAQLSGAGTEEFQRFAAGAKTVGIEQDKLGDIFKDFREKVGEFVQTGGGGMKDFFEQIAPKVGVTADAFRNLSGPQALQLYVDTLEKAGLSQEQMSFYLESMASDTTALIPLLKNGGVEITALGDAASKTGQILDNETIRASIELKKQMDEFKGIMGGITTQIAATFIPHLSSMASGFLNVARDVGIAQAAIVAFGGVVARALNIDEVAKLTREAAKANFEIKSLGRQLDMAMSFGDTGTADKLRVRLEARMKDASALAQQLKDIANPPQPSAPTPSAWSYGPQLPWSTPSKTTTAKATRASSRGSAKEETPFVGPMPDIGQLERYNELKKEAASLQRSLMTETERLAETEAKYFEMLGEGLITPELFQKAMSDLNEEIIKPVDEGYWDKWIQAAEENLTSFDDLAKSVIENFSSGFGNAFEKMIFDSESLGDAIYNLTNGMARAVVNAAGEMAAQWVAMEIVKRMASQATTSAVVAGTATQAAAGVAANTTAAASAAVTGPTIAAAMAPAAVATSVATAGTNTIPAMAGLLAAMALIPLIAGARANGGPVAGGKTYLVGERGPELFTPNTSGAIIPNHALGGSSGRNEYNINVTVPAGSPMETRRAAAAGAREALGLINQAGRYA